MDQNENVTEEMSMAAPMALEAVALDAQAEELYPDPEPLVYTPTQWVDEGEQDAEHPYEYISAENLNAIESGISALVEKLNESRNEIVALKRENASLRDSLSPYFYMTEKEGWNGAASVEQNIENVIWPIAPSSAVSIFFCYGGSSEGFVVAKANDLHGGIIGLGHNNSGRWIVYNGSLSKASSL
ncbi:hypothetical protein AALA69_07545 [Eggerthellaceae bacterium 24-137]